MNRNGIRDKDGQQVWDPGLPNCLLSCHSNHSCNAMTMEVSHY